MCIWPCGGSKWWCYEGFKKDSHDFLNKRKDERNRG